MSPKARDDLTWWAFLLALNGVASWLMGIPFWLLPAAWAAYVGLCFLVEMVIRP